MVKGKSNRGWNSPDATSRLAGFEPGQSHGHFDPSNSLGQYPERVARKKPLSKNPDRVRTSGIVGPEVDWGVRNSYIPIGLRETIRSWYKVLDHKIFSNETENYVSIHGRNRKDTKSYARNRPPTGFMPPPTWWNDAQVRNWTKMAHHLGVQFNGTNHYTVKKIHLGKWVAGHNYANIKPRGLEEPLPRFERVTPRVYKRSPLAKHLRKLRRMKRSFEVKPLSLTSILGVRKVMTHREMNHKYHREHHLYESKSSFKDSIPNCLSIKLGKPLQVSQITLDALRKIYSHPKRFMTDMSWVIPKGKEPAVTLSMKVAQKPVRGEKLRLIAMLTSENGGTFRAMHTTGPQLYLATPSYPRMVHTDLGRDYPSVLENQRRWQHLLDEDDQGEYQPGQVLGGWFD